MDRGVVVREAGSLDGGKTVFASQKDHAVFWDVETGLEKARFGERIYLFSHDEKRFATFSRTPRNEIRIYAYPSMVLQLNLEGAEGKGPSALEFSPDDQYLLVQFNNYYPLSDDNYPIPEMSKSVYAIRLYDLGSGRVIEEFERGNPVVRIVGVFSEDSRYYYVRDVGAGNRLEVNDSRRFDLSSLKWFGTE
jgi:WD40 repeat protein